MNKKITPTLIGLSLCLFSSLSSASESVQQGRPHGEKNAQLEAAMKECATTSGKDSSGRPDRQAFETCMSSKGFKKPEGMPPGKPGQNGEHQGAMPQPGQQELGTTSSFQ